MRPTKVPTFALRGIRVPVLDMVAEKHMECESHLIQVQDTKLIIIKLLVKSNKLHLPH